MKHWTVKQLREALANLPDDAEVRVATRGSRPVENRLAQVAWIPEVNGTALTDLDPELVTDQLLDKADWVAWLATYPVQSGATQAAWADGYDGVTWAAWAEAYQAE